MKQRTFWRILILSAFGFGVAACSGIPKAQMPNILAQPNIPMHTAYQISDKSAISAEQQPSLAAMRWQDFYADKKLKNLIELALTNNKDLQKAVLAIQNAQAQFQISNSKQYPSLGMGGEAMRSVRAGDTNPMSAYSVNLAMSGYELDLWGKVASLKQQALHQYLATNAAKDAVQISLISGVAQAYVNLSYAMAHRQLAIETLKTREHSLLINQKRFEAGVDARSPSLQAEASLESAKLAIYAADEQISLLKNALRLLLGVSIPEDLLPPMAVNQISTQTLFSTGLPSELLHYRPDIIRTEHALKAAGANIQVARAAYFPSISLSTQVGFSSRALSDLFGSNQLGWSFGPNISLPIFDGGVRDANYQMAQIAQQTALSDYEKTIQQAFKEVMDVLAMRSALQQQLQSQYKLQQNYQQIYNIAYARFQAGMENYLPVLDAERSLFANQQQILQLEQKQVISQIQLYQVLGGGIHN